MAGAPPPLWAQPARRRQPSPAPAAAGPPRLPPHIFHAASSTAAAVMRDRRAASKSASSVSKDPSKSKRRGSGGLLLALPADIQAHVLGLLSVKDLGWVAQVCTSWRRVGSEPSIWRARFQDRWPKAFSRASVAMGGSSCHPAHHRYVGMPLNVPVE